MNEPEPAYRGRFAPSPSGPLHFGSLVAAVGSFLEARSRNGTWLVRMEDLDPPREQPGAADGILADLEAFGLTWDGDVVYQSGRQIAYEDALTALDAQGLTYLCSCSRRDIAEAGKGQGGNYPGTCRRGPRHPDVALATRVRVPEGIIHFRDRLQGEQSQDLAADVGDFILRRRDGLVAYQLAVVVDDADQKITEVVRGIDLLDSTARQISLQHFLGLPTPAYMHLPIAVRPNGDKLSKQTGAEAIRGADPGRAIAEALRFLRHPPPPELEGASAAELLSWGTASWTSNRLNGLEKSVWQRPPALDAAQ